MVAEHFSEKEVTSRVISLFREIPQAVVLIDGRSGSGKSSLAAALLGAIVLEDGIVQQPVIELISMEDLYDGWSGLEQGAKTLEGLMQAKSAGAACEYRAYDWALGEFAELRQLDPYKAWLVEGCGSISAATVALSDLSIWVELAAETRLERVILREPDAQEWWLQWNEQHNAFIQREHSPEIAEYFITHSAI
ncbi:MAG: hypothetical protein WBA28_03725 [Microbacteriaceae bacterium]